MTAEEYFANILDTNQIPYKHNVMIGRYEIDFLIGNIDLEIDGKCHLKKQRKDKSRDKNLNSLGYIVYRIPWNINGRRKQQRLQTDIDNFLVYIKDYLIKTT